MSKKTYTEPTRENIKRAHIQTIIELIRNANERRRRKKYWKKEQSYKGGKYK